MKKNLTVPFFGFLVVLLFFSCIKDTDFDQAESFTITPVVELDLIYFNLEAGDFYDETTSNQILTLRDTTEIRFLDDNEFQESLIQADFLFRFTNTIPRTFNVDFQFLSEQNELTYFAETAVTAGSQNNPVVTIFEETVAGDDIVDLTSADKVVVSVTIPSSDASLEGTLNLKSKTTYYLEIKDQG